MPGTTESSTSGSTTSSPRNSSGAERSQVEEPIQKKTWREKFKRNWMMLRQGHEAMMMGKIQRQNRMVEDNARAQLIDAYGEDAVSPKNDDEDDGMGVNVGNETHYHYQMSQPQQPKQPSNIVPSLAAAAIAAALFGTAGGLGMLAFTSGGPAPTVDTDTDTITEVTPGFGVPENVETEK